MSPIAHLQDTRYGGGPSLIELNRGYWECNSVKYMPTEPYDLKSRDANKPNASIDDDGGRIGTHLQQVASHRIDVSKVHVQQDK